MNNSLSLTSVEAIHLSAYLQFIGASVLTSTSEGLASALAAAVNVLQRMVGPRQVHGRPPMLRPAPGQIETLEIDYSKRSV